MRQVVTLSALIFLTACGGGRGVSGEIGRACMASGRSAANPALCSCIQTVADRELTRAEQRRGAAFFDDPQRAQDTRQAGDPSSSAFWRKWRAFADRAEAQCR